MNHTKSKQFRFKCWKKKLDPARLKNQRPLIPVKGGLTKSEWNERVRLAQSREIIWNNPDIREKEQNRMEDFLE